MDLNRSTNLLVAVYKTLAVLRRRLEPSDPRNWIAVCVNARGEVGVDHGALCPGVLAQRLTDNQPTVTAVDLIMQDGVRVVRGGQRVHAAGLVDNAFCGRAGVGWLQAVRQTFSVAELC
jgi:hypothetical protein